MKKLVLCLAAFFILVNIAGAEDGKYYKLEKDSLVFANVSHYIKFIDLADDIGVEYYNDLTGNDLALMTNEALIVYKFDKFTYKNIDFYRVKVKNDCKIKYINKPKKIWVTRSFKEDEILGWVADMCLKKIKKAK